MASTLLVHSKDERLRNAYWAALQGADSDGYFCASLRMVALVFGAGLFTEHYQPPSPSPPTPPGPSFSYACSPSKAACVLSPEGGYANATACRKACVNTFACDQETQQCSQSPSGNFSSLSACNANCPSSACSNKPYAQCGGKTYHGETCCPEGFHCVGTNYYLQCQPTSVHFLVRSSVARKVEL